MATRREKSERRAFARLQDEIESMADADLLAAINSMHFPVSPKLWSCLSRALREQLAVNRERRRIGGGEDDQAREDQDDF